MQSLLDDPWLFFALSFAALWLATQVGAAFLRKRRAIGQNVREDYNTILAATLTLSGLIIGFSFSMAINRYEQRKILEEAEANSIGTEYLRVELFSAADADKVRALLTRYLDARIEFYQSRDRDALSAVNERTAQLQDQLWAAVRDAAKAAQTPTIALAVAGMNDVLNSQGYTQAAWWNRIPTGAWILMIAIALMGNLLVGYGAESVKNESALLMVLPFVFSICFLLVADIDSPRGGIIRVIPQNLAQLAASLHVHGSSVPALRN
jgi:hypothetical protein